MLKMLVLGVVVALGASSAAYARLVQRIRSHGVVLAPRQQIAPVKVIHYTQFDPAWGSDVMGSSRTTLRESGCLVTVLASNLRHLGVRTTPGELNARLGLLHGYTRDGSVIWSRFKASQKGIQPQYRHVFSSRVVEQDLLNQRLPMVQIRRGWLQRPHWLLVVGADARDFLVMDPARRSATPARLGQYGRVHAYRVLKRV